MIIPLLLMLLLQMMVDFDSNVYATLLQADQNHVMRLEERFQFPLLVAHEEFYRPTVFRFFVCIYEPFFTTILAERQNNTKKSNKIQWKVNKKIIEVKTKMIKNRRKFGQKLTKKNTKTIKNGLETRKFKKRIEYNAIDMALELSKWKMAVYQIAPCAK